MPGKRGKDVVGFGDQIGAGVMETAGRLLVKSQLYLKPIPVDRIVGSENRHQDFSLGFRPKKTMSRQRWMRIDLAFREMWTLPPIAVYEVGSHYFVRDGNHRVSVAKDQGIAFIDAEVSSIGRDLALSPDMSTSQMLQAITVHKRDRFFTATELPLALQSSELNFSQETR